MVVGVVADRMALGGDLLEPIDVLLFERLSDRERMDHAAAPLDSMASVDSVIFGGLIQIALFVVPVLVFPSGKVAAHFQVERNCDLGLFEFGRWWRSSQQLS